VKRILLIVGALLGVFGIGALLLHASAKTPAGSGSSSAPTAANNVVIDNFSFAPAVLTIPAGTTVTWTNRDDIPHTVTESAQHFKSTALDTDDSFSHTFDEPGTYEYFCSLHPKMTGRIVVEPKK
jgi:plastocyanin